MPVKKTPAETPETDKQPQSITVLSLFGQQASFPVNLYLIGIIVILVFGLVQKNSAPTRIYQFWTPDVQTWVGVLHSCGAGAKNDIHKIDRCKKKIQPWKAGHSTNHPTLERFGQALKDKLNLQKFTRYEMTGSGQYITEIKGWMWKIILPDDKKLNENLFLEIYQNHFKRKDVKIEKLITLKYLKHSYAFN